MNGKEFCSQPIYACEELEATHKLEIFGFAVPGSTCTARVMHRLFAAAKIRSSMHSAVL